MNLSKLASAVAVCSLLIACGGSGGSSNNPPVSSVSNSSSSEVSSSSSETSSSSSNSSPSSSSSSSTATACDNFNTVTGFASLSGGTTGGADIGDGNNLIVATSGADINNALTNASLNSLPLTIYVDGVITWENSGNGPIRIRRNNVSIIGRTNAEFDGVGIEVSHGASNVIVRNLKMHEYPQSRGAGDLISLDGRNGAVRKVWIDHNELFNSLLGPGCANADCHKDYFDELVSGRGDVGEITISYNYLHDSWKTSLWGSSDSDNENRTVTFHNNYWHKVNSRLPLFRFGEAHIFNNYYHEVEGSAINSRMGAVMRIDGNHFESVKNPVVSIDSAELGFWTVNDNIFDSITTSNGSCTSGSPPCYGAHETSTIADQMPPYDYTILSSAEVKAHVLENAGTNKINHCLGFEETNSSSSSSSSSSVMPEGPVSWNIYNADELPATPGSVALANGGLTEFVIGGNETGTAHDAFTLSNGEVTFDTSIDASFTHHASINDVVNSNGDYPKYFTLLAGVTGNDDNLRGLEIEVAMADAGETGSRVKMLLRPEEGGVQLEQANNGTSVASYQSPGVDIDMSVFRVYHLTITLTSATTGTVNVYSNGHATPMTNLNLADVTMRPTSSAGSNYLRIGDGGGSAYNATIDWVIWSSEGSYTPAQLHGQLPAGVGQVTGYEAT